MKKILFFLILCGCAAPSFSTELCLQECNQCHIANCFTICSEMNAGLNSARCHDVAQKAWDCAISTQCEFPVRCEMQVNEYLMCE